MTWRFPITLKRYGDSSTLPLPLEYHQRMRIKPDQEVAVTIREVNGAWRVTFDIPRSLPANPDPVTINCSESDTPKS